MAFVLHVTKHNSQVSGVGGIAKLPAFRSEELGPAKLLLVPPTAPRASKSSVVSSSTLQNIFFNFFLN